MSGYIYIIKIPESTKYKIGKTINPSGRLKSYRTAYGHNVDYLHLFWVTCMDIIEKLIHYNLRSYKASSNAKEEIFQGDIKEIKKIINDVINIFSSVNRDTSRSQYIFLNRKDILTKVKKWSGQRPLDVNKVSEIVNYQIEYKRINKVFDTFRTIVACKISSQNSYFVIDGQHRLESYHNLMMETHTKISGLMFQIINVETEMEILKQFQILNKIKPVAEFYLTSSQSKKFEIESVCQSFMDKFPVLIAKPRAKRVVRPYIKVETLKEQIYEVFKDNIENTSKKLIIDTLNEFNEHCKKNIFLFKASKNIKEKAGTHGLYITLIPQNQIALKMTEWKKIKTHQHNIIFYTEDELVESISKILNNTRLKWDLRPHRPYIIIKNLHNVIKQIQIINLDVFLIDLNKKLKEELTDANFIRKNKISKPMIKVANNMNLYLGILLKNDMLSYIIKKMIDNT